MRIFVICAWLGVAAVVAAVAAYIVLVLPKGELGEARGWSVLQSVEVKYRTSIENQNPLLLVKPLESDFIVLGLPSTQNL